MGVGGGLYMYDVVLKKFTFAISSPDEFLLNASIVSPASECVSRVVCVGRKDSVADPEMDCLARTRISHPITV